MFSLSTENSAGKHGGREGDREGEREGERERERTRERAILAQAVSGSRCHPLWPGTKPGRLEPTPLVGRTQAAGGIRFQPEPCRHTSCTSSLLYFACAPSPALPGDLVEFGPVRGRRGGVRGRVTPATRPASAAYADTSAYLFLGTHYAGRGTPTGE